MKRFSIGEAEVGGARLLVIAGPCVVEGAEIEVEFPSGASVKKVINMCANNYLGLSSHPEVIEAARKGLDHRSRRGHGLVCPV